MGTQREIWQQEHISPETFVRIHSDTPSGPVVRFVDFLKENGVELEHARVLDIGCGKGRNSIFLAKKGIGVVGIDFVPEAVADAESRVGEEHIEFRVMDLT